MAIYEFPFRTGKNKGLEIILDMFGLNEYRQKIGLGQ